MGAKFNNFAGRVLISLTPFPSNLAVLFQHLPPFLGLSYTVIQAFTPRLSDWKRPIVTLADLTVSLNPPFSYHWLV